MGGGVSLAGLFVPGDWLELKGSWFRTEGEDFIDLSVRQPALFRDCNPFVPGACDGTTTSANVDRALLFGFELEGRYESRYLRARLGASTVRGKDTESGTPLGVLTPTELHLDAAWKLRALDTLVGWRILAASELDRVADPADARSGYVVHDFYLSWAPRRGALRGLRLDLGIDNAFDKSYSRVFTGAAEAGRNVKAALTWEARW